MSYQRTCAILLLILFSAYGFGKSVDTFYGAMEVDEPVLLELIEAPAFQRLKKIHQYGVAYYTTYTEEYNRYDHSVGVFALLRKRGAPLEEQIAGLLHDVSHTVFSHVGDWIFEKANQEKDYQNSIHAEFLEASGLAEILNRYGIAIDAILPEEHLFHALECRLPDLSADRIDYNIQGAFHQGFLDYGEALEIFNDLKYADQRWVSSRLDLMKKMAAFSLFMTENCWGSPNNHFSSKWLAEAILKAREIGGISDQDIHFGTDDDLWNRLQQMKNQFITERMQRLNDSQNHFQVVDFADAEMVIKSKFRGIDPIIATEGGLFRLTEIDPEYASAFAHTRLVLDCGWPVMDKTLYQNIFAD